MQFVAICSFYDMQIAYCILKAKLFFGRRCFLLDVSLSHGKAAKSKRFILAHY